jgi:hypothetical protein
MDDAPAVTQADLEDEWALSGSGWGREVLAGAT